MAAHCVVTHSSLVGLQAMMVGRPAYCAPECGYAPLCLRPGEFTPIAPPVHYDAVQGFLNRFAWSVWREDEVRQGLPFNFLLENHYA